MNTAGCFLCRSSPMMLPNNTDDVYWVHMTESVVKNTVHVQWDFFSRREDSTTLQFFQGAKKVIPWQSGDTCHVLPDSVL